MSQCVKFLSIFRKNRKGKSTKMASGKTFQVCNYPPKKISRQHQPPDVKVGIAQLQQYKDNNCTEILQRSELTPSVYRENGFVNTVTNAYNCHHNLIIRPDDVWAAIMIQFSFYVNKHAEEFRSKFVNFTGKKTLVVTVPGRLRSAPYSLFVELISKEIDENLADPEVTSWILPNFSTTTVTDLVSVGVVFMATMKKYFDFKCCACCGIPNITLEGTIDDWTNILQRLEKLNEYQLEYWYEMLQPILQKFVDAMEGKIDRDFWSRIAHYEGGMSGITYLSGWITAFCIFDSDGNLQCDRSHPKPKGKQQWMKIETEDVPPGIVEVDVKIDDNGTEHDGLLIAGHLGTLHSSDRLTLQPVLGWAMALKGPKKDKTKKFYTMMAHSINGDE